MTSKNEILKLITESPSKYGTETGFKKHFPDMYLEIMKIHFPDNFAFKQKLYHYLHNDFELNDGLCGTCGKRTTFLGSVKGYSPYCSIKCAMANPKTREKYKETCQSRYGVDNSFQIEEVKEKICQTNLERYGVENVSQNNAVKEKTKATNLERYGVEHPLQSKEIMNRAEETNVKRYGVAHYSNSEKRKETWRKKSKKDVSLIIETRNATNRERYGANSPMQNENVLSRMERTCEERYGVKRVLQNKEIRDAMVRHCVEAYGVENVFQLEDVKEKVRQTNVVKYGVENVSQNEEIKEKIRQTNLERFGVEWACMRPEARNYSVVSKVNIAFAEQLKANGIEYEMEYPLGSYSYDFKVNGTLIEINPSITHNVLFNPFGRKGLESNYHLLKTARATDNGYRCIHIWDWDDVNKIVNMLKPKQTLYARELELKEVGETKCNQFLNAYHLQSTCRRQVVRLGLYIDDMLVELITFGKPRYNKNYEYELLRLCSHSDYIVTGGAERLFKHFIEHYNPQSIISYCDASKFNGGVYKRLGFSLKDVSSPSKHWYNLKTQQHITDNLLRQRGFDQLFNADYGKGTDNEKLMLEHGFLPVYDCGQMRFEWKAK